MRCATLAWNNRGSLVTAAEVETGASVDPLMVWPITVGREPQLASISHLLDQLMAGRGRTVLVTGEAGIGKSRLVAEARALSATRGVRVLQGSAFEVDQALPYGAVVDLFRMFLAGKTPQQALEVLGVAAA